MSIAYWWNRGHQLVHSSFMIKTKRHAFSMQDMIQNILQDNK